jgi:hypothetical protein
MVAGSDPMLALVSRACLDSVFGQVEWRAAFRVDPAGTARGVIPVRVEACAIPPRLDGVVGFDLFGLTPDAAGPA